MRDGLPLLPPQSGGRDGFAVRRRSLHRNGGHPFRGNPRLFHRLYIAGQAATPRTAEPLSSRFLVAVSSIVCAWKRYDHAEGIFNLLRRKLNLPRCELNLPQGRFISAEGGFNLAWGIGNPDQGRFVPLEVRLNPEQGIFDLDQVRFNLQRARFDPERGNGNPERQRAADVGKGNGRSSSPPRRAVRRRSHRRAGRCYAFSSMRRASLLFLLILPWLPAALAAAPFPCKPCAGLRLEPPNTPDATAALLHQIGHLEPGSPLYLAWETDLAPTLGQADPAAAGKSLQAVRAAGGTPWISLVFHTPAPLAQGSERLQGELRAAAAIAAQAPPGAWLQVVWRPEGQESAPFAPAEYAFLLKRAAVALTGAKPEARVATEPLPADAKALETLYGEEVAAYLEAVSLAPAPDADLAAAVAAVQRLDPGRPLVLDALPLPQPPARALAETARAVTQGFDLALFRSPALPADVPAGVPAETLAPFVVLAREFAGDLSYDERSNPTGAAAAWTFVRGKDLALRVIATAPDGARELALRFPDPTLRRPTRFPYAAGKVAPPTAQVTGSSFEMRVDNPGSVAILGLERETAEERKGVAEKVTVAGQREMPVEEILRRLQAFEDAQDRRLDHYSAINSTSLRFQPAAGSQTFEATLQGPFFFSKTGTDWAWQTLYVNGVRWRAKKLPEIPLIQPEKAAAVPLAIHFTKQYRYRLRGSDRLDGRDAWVVDFAPSDPAEKGRLYQGSVWIDKQVYARLRTRAVQVGLEGEVISNEETMSYSPIDAQGNPAAWSAESFVLPLHLVAQQILSVVNATTVVERDTQLTNVRINDPNFEAQRAEVNASDTTMVRDTDKGLRYLVKDDSGQRVVKEGFDSTKLFALGGVFYDDAMDYPLPLAGINYLSFDFKGTGNQLNVFFAGALLTANMAQPRLFGSRFDFGGSAFALAVPVTDSLYRSGQKSAQEDVKLRTGNASLKIGHPVGNFLKFNLEYQALLFNYNRTKDTAHDFIVPSNNITHSVELTGSFSRAGYGLRASGSYNLRSKWDFWGTPGNTEFSKNNKDFLRWDGQASKSWYLPHFQKIGAEVDYVGGSDLDRFSKYQFGFFGETRVHGYQSGKVRAEKATSSHLTYGFEIGEFLRLDAVADAAWATDKVAGLHNEFLGGVGLAGTFIGPWQTVVNLDFGVPVAGPDNGFVLYVVFLKLLR
jgi:hypothetical protein